MEALYKKLYDKYTKLKEKKMSELDQLNKDQEVKFLNYVSAAEELIQHLKSENDRLRLQVNELRGEVASIRSNIDAKCADYQKLLMEENHRKIHFAQHFCISLTSILKKIFHDGLNPDNTLSEEVEKLQKLHQGGNFGFNNGKSNEHLDIPGDSHIVPGEVSKGSSGRTTRKRSRDAAPETEELRTLYASAQNDVIIRQPTDVLSQKSVSSGAAEIRQLECCGRNIDQLGGMVNQSVSTNCPYQCLVEHLMGMELSTTNQNEGICISAMHKSSGYSFSLTWVNKLAGDVEILYRVLSLGAFERVAPEWMKEAIMFSTSMCPIFFEKVTRVIRLHC